MKILVTGGAGFIGSNFVRWASGLGHDVLVLDSLTYAGDLSNLKDAKHRFFKGDVCYSPFLTELLSSEKPDAVVHYAAETHVDRSITDPASFLYTNVGGTHTLLDACRKVGGKLRYIQISTDEVYGSADDRKPFTEESQLKPSSPYSASKASADMFVLAYHRTYGLDALVTRCSNNYGPHQYPEKLIPLFVRNLLKGKHVPVYGDGLQVRDWIYCDDHSRGVMAALEKGAPGQVYNLGGGKAISNMEVARTLIKLTDRDETFIDHVVDRPGHDRFYLMDYSKATRELGWEPTVPFENGLRTTVNWYRDHLARWS